LVRGLLENSSLTSLDLYLNFLNADGASMLLSALSHVPNLNSLSLEDNGINNTEKLSLQLSKNTTLTHLNLGANKLGHLGATLLCQALETNTSLTSLDLHQCLIGVEKGFPISFTPMFESLTKNHTLKHLNLMDNPFNEGLVQPLASFLQHTTSLTSLILRNCNISAKGVLTLLKALKTNTSIISFRFLFKNLDQYKFPNPIDASSTLIELLQTNSTDLSFLEQKQILDALKQNTSLKELDLFGHEELLTYVNLLFQNRTSNSLWNKYLIKDSTPIKLYQKIYRLDQVKLNFLDNNNS
jgi:hypothetical protein